MYSSVVPVCGMRVARTGSALVVLFIMLLLKVGVGGAALVAVLVRDGEHVARKYRLLK